MKKRLILAAAIPTLIFFHSPNCRECIKAKTEVMPAIESEFKGKIEIDYRDITDIENYKFLLSLKEKYKAKIKIDLPVLFFEGKFLEGKEVTESSLKGLIVQSLKIPPKEIGLLKIDLLERFKNLRPLAIIVAGLEDGINPCAFTVIVFFVSFLALQGYRKRELIVIGLTFIFAVFLTYLSIGLGIFNFLYAIKGIWIVIRAVNVLVGLFSIVLGILALYDFFKFKKTGQTEGLFLQLPQSVKNRIHYIIGLHYRKHKDSDAVAVKPHIFKLFLSALITGFLVSLLEAVCTGQLYLPTITFVLKTTPLKLQAFGYLLLYNLLFIVPLLAIFFFALFGVTSEQFGRFLKKHLGTIKILMALLFFSLGVFLIWRA